MTLQYRSRSTFEDGLWGQRVYLCERFLTEVFDAWCQAEDEFPAETTIAGVLHLFSPKRWMYDVRPYRLVETLSKAMGTAEEEYRHAWPNRSPQQARELIEALAAILAAAATSWQSGQMQSTRDLTAVIEKEIVARQYVVFHHYETTKRG